MQGPQAPTQETSGCQQTPATHAGVTIRSLEKVGSLLHLQAHQVLSVQSGRLKSIKPGEDRTEKATRKRQTKPADLVLGRRRRPRTTRRGRRRPMLQVQLLCLLVGHRCSPCKAPDHTVRKGGGAICEFACSFLQNGIAGRTNTSQELSMCRILRLALSGPCRQLSSAQNADGTGHTKTRSRTGDLPW